MNKAFSNVRSLSEKDFLTLVKDAELSADALAPLIGALAGGGIGLAADAVRPADEDEDRLKRRITSILAGAAMGGMAGHGLREFGKASPLVGAGKPPVAVKDAPEKKKKEFNPSWNTAAGTALTTIPLLLLARGKLKSMNPEVAKRILRRAGQAAAVTSVAAGGTMVARNQLRKNAEAQKTAFFYSAPKDTDRNDVRYGLSKATRDRIYANTREDMADESGRASAGSGGLTWQGFFDPVTGEWRSPVSWGSTKANVRNSSMTPTQANMVSLLTKNKGIQDYRQMTSALNGNRGRTWRTYAGAGAALAALPLLLLGRGKGSGVLKRLGRRVAGLGAAAAGTGMLIHDNANKGSNGLDFMRDPSVVNLHSGKLTQHGLDDLKFAFKAVHGRDPTEFDMERLNRRMDRILGTNAGANGNPYRFESILPRTF